MKKLADQHRREVTFQVDEEAFLKLQPYRFKKLAKRPNEKLSSRFYGPYKILERIGPVAYRLQLPTDSKVHPVFHVSQLKKVRGFPIPSQPLPSCLAEDGELQLKPEELVDYRYSASGHLQVLLKWKGLPASENTWEDYSEAVVHFSDFHLEDKVKLKGGRADRPLISRVYARKKRADLRRVVLENLLTEGESLNIPEETRGVRGEIMPRILLREKGIKDKAQSNGRASIMTMGNMGISYC